MARTRSMDHWMRSFERMLGDRSVGTPTRRVADALADGNGLPPPFPNLIGIDLADVERRVIANLAPLCPVGEPENTGSVTGRAGTEEAAAAAAAAAAVADNYVQTWASRDSDMRESASSGNEGDVMVTKETVLQREFSRRSFGGMPESERQLVQIAMDNLMKDALPYYRRWECVSVVLDVVGKLASDVETWESMEKDARKTLQEVRMTLNEALAKAVAQEAEIKGLKAKLAAFSDRNAVRLVRVRGK